MPLLALLRLSLVRFGASFMVVLTTGVINRVFIGDLGYSESWFDLLLCLQQLATPLTLWTGYWSDMHPLFGRFRAPHVALWSIVSALALAALILLLATTDRPTASGLFLYLLAGLAMALFGLGVKASNLLVTALLFDQLPPRRRVGAFTFVWFVAIAGLVIAGLVYGRLFENTDQIPLRHLTTVTLGTCLAVIALTLAGVVGVERPRHRIFPSGDTYAFRKALAIVLRNPHARWFFGFLALAEFSFYCQDLILEVYGGRIFQLSLSVTTEYSFYQGLGTLLGMALGWSLQEALWVRTRVWQLPLACLLGALAFAFLVGSAMLDVASLATAAIILLGVAKGAYNAALAGALMEILDRRLVGVLLGMWGTVSGVAIAAAMFFGGLMRQEFLEAALAARVTPELAARISFAGVFAVELIGLLVAALMLLRFRPRSYRERLDREIESLTTIAPARP